MARSSYVKSIAARARVPLTPADTVEHMDLILGVLAEARTQGLDPGEARAFVEAWRPILDAPTWRILAFYPSEAVDTVAQLKFEPPPREVVRALAFTVDAPPATP